MMTSHLRQQSSKMITPVVLFVLIYTVNAIDIEIPDASYPCGSHEFVVDDETFYVLRYKGDDPGAGGCTYKFKGDNAVDHYKLCAQLEDLDFMAGFYLEIYEGDSNKPKKTYTALSDRDPHHKKHPVCGETTNDLSIKIEADEHFINGTTRKTENSKTYFRVRITGVKILDFAATYGPIIGGVVAVIVILAIIIAIGLFLYLRRRRYSGAIERPNKETQ